MASKHRVYAVGTESYWVSYHEKHKFCFSYNRYNKRVNTDIQPEDVNRDENMYRIYTIEGDNERVVMTWNEFRINELEYTWFEVGAHGDDSKVYCLFNLITKQVRTRKSKTQKWLIVEDFVFPEDAVFSGLVRVNLRTLGSAEVNYHTHKVWTKSFLRDVQYSLGFEIDD